jgi:drug/metabolite transporter (DMT)-like permease
LAIGIVLALAAGVCTAGASIAQRSAAATASSDLRFSPRLLGFLLRRPMWLAGIGCMVGGFVCQVSALHFAGLALVQPVIASELVFVFAYLALRHPGRVRAREWGAAGGMAVALAGFLLLADPSGGRAQAPTGILWSEAAGASALGCALCVLLALVKVRGGPTSPARKAAMLGLAGGFAWGFVAAVVKEVSGRISQGPAALLLHWSPYVLAVCGAVGIFLVANAFQAGPLAASQPALTVSEPVAAIALGVALFGEHLRDSPAYLAGEAGCGLLLALSVAVLSHSPLIAEERGGTGAERARPAGATVASPYGEGKLATTPAAPAGSGTGPRAI